MNCRKVSHLLSAYMDNELPGVEHRQIQKHLLVCPECRNEYRSLLQLKRMVASLRMKPPRPELPARILERVAEEEVRLETPWPLAWIRQVQKGARTSVPSLPMALGAGLLAAGVLFTFGKIRMAEANEAEGIVWTAGAVAEDPPSSAPPVREFTAGLEPYAPAIRPPQMQPISRYFVPSPVAGGYNWREPASAVPYRPRPTETLLIWTTNRQ